MLASRVGRIVLAVSLTCPLFSQGQRGNITGEIKDTSGASVPSVVVTATNVATNVSTTTVTTTAGEYNVPLPPGLYRVVASAPGFKRYARENVTLAAASTVRLDMVLKVGAITETLEVSASALQVQTEDAKVSTSVQNRSVDLLPLVVGGGMRSPFDLLTVVAETKGLSTGIGNGFAAALSLGGGQASAWDATLDGVSVTTSRSATATEIAYNTPSVEAITEFTVDTNGFKGEYGQSGGGVITFSSKSGTNDPHGVAYDFLRNDDMDARGFFGPTRPVYKQNDFGATFGGPIYIPKI